jgi:hypothetical protein
VDPRRLFVAAGFEVLDEGRHLSIRMDGHEHYRSTFKDDGHWVHCRADESGVGDNIDLVRELRNEPDLPFTEAVWAVQGSPTLAPGPSPRRYAPQAQERPRLPRQSEADREAGRDYLSGRGISEATLDDAESSGFLRYCGGAVVFCGYDASGAIRSATKRVIDPEPGQPSKRDFKGTEKAYAPVLRGDGDPKTIWVVEGGADALAVHELYQLQGRPVPTVIVSGGAGVRSWTKKRRELLAGAKRIYIAHERENDDATQAKTDAAHERQAEAVAEVTSAEVHHWRPQDDQCKDLADVLLARLKEQERERLRQAELEDDGPSMGM